MKLFVWATTVYSYESYAVMAEDIASAEKAIVDFMNKGYKKINEKPYTIDEIYEDAKLIIAEVNEVVQISEIN